MGHLRLTLFLFLVLSYPIAAELDVKAKLDDPRITERKVYIRSSKINCPIRGTQISKVEVYLPASDLGRPNEESWELYYETSELLRQTASICKHNPQGQKCHVRGREIVTLHGRGLLIEYIRSNW